MSFDYTQADVFERLDSVAVFEALRAWQNGEVAPVHILQLRLLDAADRDQDLIRDVLLYEWVASTTIRRICHFLSEAAAADALGQPETQAQRLASFRAVMAEALDRENHAAAWVALHYRWVLPDGLPPGQMAEAAAISERHLRRLVRQGVRLLAQELRRAELAAHRGGDDLS